MRRSTAEEKTARGLPKKEASAIRDERNDAREAKSKVTAPEWNEQGSVENKIGVVRAYE